MNDHYQPIDCGLHSEYELLVMQHSDIRLVFTDSNGTRQVVCGVPTNVTTRDGAEFLLIEHTDSQISVRLDRIVSCTKID